MTEIKKGDWVYWKSPHSENDECVFKVDSFTNNRGKLFSKEHGFFDSRFVYRLTQRAPVAQDPDKEPKLEYYASGLLLDKSGEMFGCYRGTGETDEDYRDRIVARVIKLSKVPNSQPDIRMEVLGQKEPLPCPHPEWEGVWLYCGEAHRIEWDGTEFMAHEINTTDMDVFCLCPDTEWYSDGPTPRWTQLEPAPTASTAGQKLPRPHKHGCVTVPWDPYGNG